MKQPMRALAVIGTIERQHMLAVDSRLRAARPDLVIREDDGQAPRTPTQQLGWAVGNWAQPSDYDPDVASQIVVAAPRAEASTQLLLLALRLAGYEIAIELINTELPVSSRWAKWAMDNNVPMRLGVVA